LRNAHLLILVIAPAVPMLAGTDGHVSASLCFGAGVAEIMLGQDELPQGPFRLWPRA
jgi:hypothetical protein